MARLQHRICWSLALTVTALVVVGMIFVYSASSGYNRNYLPRQLVWIVLGIAAAIGAGSVPLRLWRHWALPIFLGSLASLVIVVLFGQVRNGARSWLGIGGLGIQPSEFAKLALILIVARYLSDFEEHRHDWRYYVFSFGLLSLPLILILAQPDLGTALVFAPAVLAMFYVSGTRPLLLGTTLLAGIAGVPALWLFMSERQKLRILYAWHPELQPFGIGFQALQSKIAVGSGMLSGRGLLHSIQSRLNFLPERHTDFIFSVLGEEWGFVGSVCVIGLFVWLIATALRISYHANDSFGRVVAVGIATLYSVHAILNIGMALGLLPIIGLPLPFVSYGGSAMITALAAAGLLQAVFLESTA